MTIVVVGGTGLIGLNTAKTSKRRGRAPDFGGVSDNTAPIQCPHRLDHLWQRPRTRLAFKNLIQPKYGA